MVRNVSYTVVKNIQDRVYEEAQQRANERPVYQNSYRGKEANQIGCLGEVIAEYWMKREGILYTPKLDSRKYDYIVGADITIDVKTKDRTSVPKTYFDNSAPLYNHDYQIPDYYLFISLLRSDDTLNTKSEENEVPDIKRFHKAYIVGSISYGELDNVGQDFKRNQTDENGTTFWTDCRNVQMGQLIPLRDTIRIFRGDIDGPSKHAPTRK
ncbi:hypothetical protein ACP3V5_16315 [Vibrio maritimus]